MDDGDDILRLCGFDPEKLRGLTLRDAAEQAPLKPADTAPAQELAKPKPSPRKEIEPFVHVTDRALLPGLKAVDSAQELAVWLYILREQRRRQRTDQHDAFALTNRALAAWGINKDTKRRAIRKLEAARLITVERDGHHSPRVKICGLR